jgi:hypothetical protein
MSQTSLPADEALITLKVAAARYPGGRGAERIHPSTISRWITTGARSTTGRLVRLAGKRLGRTWYTSWPALERFAAELAGEVAHVA